MISSISSFESSMSSKVGIHWFNVVSFDYELPFLTFSFFTTSNQPETSTNVTRLQISALDLPGHLQ